MKKNSFDDIIKIFFLLIVTFVIEGRAPQILLSAFYLFTLYLFFNSKKNYFWIAFVLIIYNYTGGLFGSNHEIVSIGLFSLTYMEAFSIVAFIKMSSTKKINLFYKKPFIIYLFYFGFLIIVGATIGMLHGKSGFGLIYMLIRNIILLSLFFSIPRLIDRENGLRAFANIFFAVIFLNLFGQFFALVTKTSFLSLVSSKSKFYEGELVRSIYGYFNVFLTLFLAMYFYTSERIEFKKKYLSLLIFLSMLSIFLTAGRGWIIAVLFILFIWMVLNFRSLKTFPVILSVIFVFFLLATKASPVIEKQLDLGMERLSTVEKIAEGDLTAGGTLQRLTSRHDKVMKKFYEKPVFGWGFSSEGFEANDYHVGNQSILMSGGIVGMAVILYLLLFIIKKTISLYGFIKRRGYSARPLSLIIIFLLGLFIIHSSSTQLFGYMPYLYPMHFNKVLFLSIMFAFFNILFVSQYNKCISSWKNKYV